MDLLEAQPNNKFIICGKYVRTWTRLIIIMLSYVLYENESKSVNIDNQTIRAIQTNYFGGKESQTCSLNLFADPLPPRSKRNDESEKIINIFIF